MPTWCRSTHEVTQPNATATAKNGKVGVLFCLQPDLAARVEGHQHAFFVTGIDRLHERHRDRGVPLVSPLGAKPWGLREYTVRDPNGYHLRFAMTDAKGLESGAVRRLNVEQR